MNTPHFALWTNYPTASGGEYVPKGFKTRGGLVFESSPV
jgi:hypothetical protein